jgi:general secretion pathway protein G
MKRGFTMIELIFVIVIIGILAVIAIPKLNATRDDAKVVTELQNISTCIQDIGAQYTATGKEPKTYKEIASCNSIKCFTFSDLASSGSRNTDGKVTIAAKTSPAYCATVRKKAIDRKIIEKNGKKSYKFGGSKIVE